jgi:multicomponent Na+:H+ antiporter subunit E
MIFTISFFLWITFFGRFTLASVVSGLLVSVLPQYISSRLIRSGPVFATAFKIILALPIAVFQAFRLIFSRPIFTVRSEKSPENRIVEFGKIISITMTPEEIVISKDREGLLIHEVKK